MNGFISEKEPKSFTGSQKNFNLAVDEIKLLRSIGDLNHTLEKIDSVEPWSERLDIIRSEIARLTKQLEALRKNKSR